VPIPVTTTNRTTSLRTYAKGFSGEPDIRRFDVKAINDAITKNMQALGEGETVAAIGYIDKTGAKVAIVGRIKSIAGKKIPGKLQWTVMNDFSFEDGGAFNPQGAFRWSI